MLISGALKPCDVRRDWYISTVQDCGPAIERIGVKRDIVATTETHFP